MTKHKELKNPKFYMGLFVDCTIMGSLFLSLIYALIWALHTHHYVLSIIPASILFSCVLVGNTILRDASRRDDEEF